MAVTIKPGTSSKQAQAMQKYLNAVFDRNVPESGTHDKARLKAVKDLQDKMGHSF